MLRKFLRSGSADAVFFEPGCAVQMPTVCKIRIEVKPTVSLRHPNRSSSVTAPYGRGSETFVDHARLTEPRASASGPGDELALANAPAGIDDKMMG